MFCTRVVRREYRDEWLGEDGSNGQAVDGIAIAQNAGIEGAIFEPLDHARGKGLVQMKTHARVGLTVRTKDARETREHARADKANVERTYFPAADAARFVDVTLDVAQRAMRAFKERFADGSQADGSRGSVKEWIPEHLFELANLLRERWLAQVEAMRCASEVKFFRHRDEVTKVTQFDVDIHMLNIIIEQNKILDISAVGQQTNTRSASAMQINSEQQKDAGGGIAGVDLLGVEIRPLRPGEDASAFRTLNEEWITRYFALEQKDREILEDPENAILRRGGHIFVAYVAGEAVGCAALIPMGDGVYELSKMAVSPRFRGLGIGRKLLEYTIAQAKAIGAGSLFLGSNTILKNAVHLYESVGFQHVPPERIPPTPYTRANVFMEMQL